MVTISLKLLIILPNLELLLLEMLKNIVTLELLIFAIISLVVLNLNHPMFAMLVINSLIVEKFDILFFLCNYSNFFIKHFSRNAKIKYLSKMRIYLVFNIGYILEDLLSKSPLSYLPYSFLLHPR